MTEDQRLLASEKYLARYRRNLAALQTIALEEQAEKNRHNQALRDVLDRRSSLQQEIHHQRQIITKMIDEGLDPVMAKLMLDSNVKADSLWDDHTLRASIGTWSGSSTNTVSRGTVGQGLLSVDSQMGAVGSLTAHAVTATGANGSTGCHTQLTVQQHPLDVIDECRAGHSDGERGA